ncbi:hypothetical protein [Ectothiorhodospira marina]|nr:hypothetical protein [Ectothiorhodospira marina]
MIRMLFPLGLATATFVVPQLAYADNWQLHYAINSQSFSDSASIHDLAKDWRNEPTPSGSIAYSRNRVTLGARRENVSVDLIYRQDWIFEFHPDTAQIVYRDKNKIPLEPGQDYRVKLRARALGAEGIRLGFESDANEGWGLRGAVSLLQVSEFQEGRLTGRVAENADGHFEGLGQIDYRYDEDHFLSHLASPPDGYGFAVDIGIFWSNEQYYASLDIEDAWTRFEWEDAPYTRGQIDTDQSSFDPDGYVSYRPLLSGVRGTEYYRPTNFLPRATTGQLGMRLEQWDVSINTFHFLGTLWPEAQLTYATQGRMHYSAAYEAKSDRITLGIASQTSTHSFQFQLGMDNERWQEAHALLINLSGAWQF